MNRFATLLNILFTVRGVILRLWAKRTPHGLKYFSLHNNSGVKSGGLIFCVFRGKSVIAFLWINNEKHYWYLDLIQFSKQS